MERRLWLGEPTGRRGAWSGREAMNAKRRMQNGQADERPGLTQKPNTDLRKNRFTELPQLRCSSPSRSVESSAHPDQHMDKWQ
jgi:hypothetical protein